MRILSIIFISALIFSSPLLWAQNTSTTTIYKRPKKKKRNRSATEEMAAGLRLNSDGWSIFMERGFINTYEKRTGFLWLDISEKQHPKEFKQVNHSYATTYPNAPAPLPFKFGKINNFYQFKVGYGQKRALTGKLDKKNVVIHWTYSAGISVGFLKPYYLEIQPQLLDPSTKQTVSYNKAETKKDFLDLGAIVSGTSFTKGFGEVKIKPGLAARSGFFFDFSPNEKSFLGIEIGSSVEYYPSEIPIMASTNNKSTFINLYLDVRYGKRWSK